jgi:hypothetical protein
MTDAALDFTGTLLLLTAIYCLVMWLILAYRTFRMREDHEFISSALGICFILAVGFLHLRG